MASSILRSIVVCLSLRCASAWDMTVSNGKCDHTGLDVAQYGAGAFDSCAKITIPGLDLAIGVKIRCTDAGSKVTIFEDKTCAHSSKRRHAYIGKSGGCMQLLTAAGHNWYGSLVWNPSECKEGPTVQASDTCQRKSNELAASEPAYIPNLHDCEKYFCPEIRRFNGTIDYGRFKSDCTCTVEYKDKQATMEKCKALPGGAKTCFVSYQVENKNGAKLHIGNGMADCLPQSCLGTEDQAALTRQWTLSCIDIPGVSTCFASLRCEDPPETTVAPEDSSVQKAIADSSEGGFRASTMTLCAALSFLCLDLL